MATTQPAPIAEEPAAKPATSPPPAYRGSGDEELMRRMKRVLFIAIPLFVLVWIGIAALAATLSDVGYGPLVAMGAAVGALAGVFWACWYGFVTFSHHEEAERRAQRSRSGDH